MTGQGSYNTYIGARYVPIFDGQWNNTKEYEPLTIVTNEGNSYTSRTYVPIGVDITNETYWALTGNYNAQIEEYRQQVIQYQKDTDEKLLSKIDDVENFLESDCFHSIAKNLQIPFVTSDGKLIGSGLNINDIIVKPKVTALNAIACFDDRGNLMQAGLNGIDYIPTNELMLNVDTGKDGVIRMRNGYQICFGSSTQDIAFTQQRGTLYRNDTSLFQAIGFQKSFSERPILHVLQRGANDYWVSGATCNNNGITAVRCMYYQELTSPISITFDWIAIGKWRP